ncbi:hypothetical protein BU26DRAFT_564873 [Trematosphaeria pertusa]|uniref:Uncharacterized protein n=1 Tax=Trematosphaeria pertusa TaxID=390896 RepID=A0A6A6II33_9PLEO|nr:uncharacterized protein BU26DRAFT_564873 [Trematosphaeria pertusa]KAF2249213.1 hypothetical protein BU26DRAFT_564873 [Trematosphaeria pertusa]
MPSSMPLYLAACCAGSAPKGHFTYIPNAGAFMGSFKLASERVEARFSEKLDYADAKLKGLIKSQPANPDSTVSVTVYVTV